MFIFQISDNGLVRFGVSKYSSYGPQKFPTDVPIVAPFWDDSVGDLKYNILTSTTGSNVTQKVNEFLYSKLKLSFIADWILVVQWLNGCPWSNPHCNEINVSLNIFCAYHIYFFYSLILFNLYWLFKTRKHMQSLHTSVIKYNGVIIRQLLGLVLMSTFM